jgi:hypothetical protein
MTKVSVFGQPTEENRELKKIELTHSLQVIGGSMYTTERQANQYEEITLLKPKSFKVDGVFRDLIMSCLDGSPHIYLGYWNDGVV